MGSCIVFLADLYYWVGSYFHPSGGQQKIFYLGNINFVAIWNKALTANEVLQTTDAIKYKFNL